MHCFEETSTGQYCDLYYRSVVIFGLVDLSFRIYTALFIDVFLVPACASCNCPQDLNYNEEFGYSDTHAGKTIILFAVLLAPCQLESVIQVTMFVPIIYF